MSATDAPIPDFIYGTAWKEDRTASLTELAVRSGFRAIDTANQRRHYDEAGVGEGLAAVYRAAIVTRSDLFLQTKFTYQRGQDHRLPYDPAARLSVQVEQSLTSSFDHLGTDYVDSFVLHGPSSGYDGPPTIKKCGKPWSTNAIWTNPSARREQCFASSSPTNGRHSP